MSACFVKGFACIAVISCGPMLDDHEDDGKSMRNDDDGWSS
jgi:hypothetical protein